MFLKRRTPQNEQIIKKPCKHSVVIMLLVSCICVGTVTTSAAPSGTTVYFKNTDNWSAVYCYSWVDGGDDKAWPGTAMTDDGNGFQLCIYKGLRQGYFQQQQRNTDRYHELPGWRV